MSLGRFAAALHTRFVTNGCGKFV